MGKRKKTKDKPQETRPPELYSKSEVEALKAACSRRAPTGIRNKALIAVAYHAGLRVQEALDLYPADIDHEEQDVHVKHGKGDKVRHVPIDGEGLAIIQAWEERRRALGFNGRQPLFCTLAGGPMQSSYVRAMLGRLQKRAGLDKRAHCHGLRHTWAMELAREGTPLSEIQALMGHANLRDTSRYLKHPVSAATRERLKNRKGGAPAGKGPLTPEETALLRELLKRAEETG